MSSTSVFNNDDFFVLHDDVREHNSDCFPRVDIGELDFDDDNFCPKIEPKEEFTEAVEDANLTAHKVINKATLASVALLTELDAARVFNMGTTRFKARCRNLGIQRWPHRKLMSLKNLYHDLTLHLKYAQDNQNQEQIDRVNYMMNEMKLYASMLEQDLSLLNKLYNGKKAWPENILKIRQIIYKKRHARVMVEKKKRNAAALNEVGEKTLVMKKQKYDEELSEEDSTTEEDYFHLDLQDIEIIKVEDDERIWQCFTVREENAYQEQP